MVTSERPRTWFSSRTREWKDASESPSSTKDFPSTINFVQPGLTVFHSALQHCLAFISAKTYIHYELHSVRSQQCSLQCVQLCSAKYLIRHVHKPPCTSTGLDCTLHAACLPIYITRSASAVPLLRTLRYGPLPSPSSCKYL